MILRHLALYLKVEEFDRDYRSDFLFRTRYFCNFLERRLGRQKFKADGFSKICVQGTLAPTDDCRIVSENALVATAFFDEATFRRITPDETHEFLIDMFQEGLGKCAASHSIPLKFLTDTIEEFREGGYRNEWVYQSKLIRGTGMRGTLVCGLDQDRFLLTLKLERGEKLLFTRVVLEAKPDELIFAHRFKSMVIDGPYLVIQDAFGGSLFRLDLTSIG